MRYHLHRRRVLRVVLTVLSLAVAAPAAFAQNPPEEIEYYATDALGSVRLVFTPAGQVLGRSDYLPFGETLNQSGALPRQRFTGQERDGEAGMDYFHARNLLARTGRMNAPDPLFGQALHDPQDWSRYAYVRNNPLRFVDPTGEQVQTIVIAIQMTPADVLLSRVSPEPAGRTTRCTSSGVRCSRSHRDQSPVAEGALRRDRRTQVRVPDPGLVLLCQILSGCI